MEKEEINEVEKELNENKRKNMKYIILTFVAIVFTIQYSVMVYAWHTLVLTGYGFIELLVDCILCIPYIFIVMHIFSRDKKDGKLLRNTIISEILITILGLVFVIIYFSFFFQ